MKVLIATTRTQGARPADYAWALDGELVYPPAVDCGAPDCGCGRSFVGMASACSTTTAMVVDRPDIDEADLSIALVDALHRQGWLDDGWTAANETIVDTIWDRMIAAAERFEEGTVLERRGDALVERSVDAAGAGRSVSC